MIAGLATIAFCALTANDVKLTFVPSGATAKIGGYSPIRAEMDAKTDSVKKAPEGLAAPKYGQLKLDQQSWSFILDEPEGKPAKLFVDTNGDGDLTNDIEVLWSPRTQNGQTMYQGSATVNLKDGVSGIVNMYRFDPKDERRPMLKNTLLYYA